FMMIRTVTAAHHGHRLLILHPYTVWKVSAEQLALYLVAEATSLRLGSGFSRSRAGRIRAIRRQYQEMVACARVLPRGDALVARLSIHLALDVPAGGTDGARMGYSSSSRWPATRSLAGVLTGCQIVRSRAFTTFGQASKLADFPNGSMPTCWRTHRHLRT